MGKEWRIERHELKEEPLLKNKLYNEEKLRALNTMLDYITNHSQDESLKTALRSLVEEVTNIIQSNKTWIDQPLKVRTEFNQNTKLIKINIQYSGTDYFDPEANNTTTVIGSKDQFKSYSRNVTFEGENTDIRIKIELN